MGSFLTKNLIKTNNKEDTTEYDMKAIYRSYCDFERKNYLVETSDLMKFRTFCKAVRNKGYRTDTKHKSKLNPEYKTEKSLFIVGHIINLETFHYVPPPSSHSNNNVYGGNYD